MCINHDIFNSNKLNETVVLFSNCVKDVCYNQKNLMNRIVRAAVPYFNFYGPFNQIAIPLSQCLLATANLKSLFIDFAEGLKKYKENEFDRSAYYKIGRGVIELVIIVSALVFKSLGMALSVGLDLINEIEGFSFQIREDKYTKEDVGMFLYRALTHTLRLGTIVSTAPEILVAFTACQIILEVGRAYQEYKQEHYLEAISNLGLALIRGVQISPQVKQIYDKWVSQKTAKRFSAQRIVLSDHELKTVERRAAIDVGSGGTKVLIADIDKNTNQIKQIVFEHSFPVPYQVSLETSVDGTFDLAVQEQALKTFYQIKDLLNHHEVEKVNAIATEAFRKSKNGASFAETISTLTQIPLKVISQQQEGIIAYHSALAIHPLEKEEAIVWDIGTGSFQITSKEGEEGYEVFTGGLGSVPFKNHIIEEIQGKDPSMIQTPNPMTEEEYKQIGRAARSFARQASLELKAKLKSLNACVIGIGRLFYNSVRPLASEDGLTINRKGLRAFIRESLNKTDQEMNNPFAHVDLPNCIQVLEVMKALHIHEIAVVNTTTTKGIVTGSEKDFTSWQAVQK